MELSSLSQRVYPVEEVEDEFQFITDTGLRYSIYFTEGEGYFQGNPFASSVLMFNFAVDDRQGVSASTGHDPKVSDTLVYALHSIFEANPELVLVYVCDTKDEREQCRDKLFKRWWRRYSHQLDSLFERITFGNKEEKTFSACIHLKNHQYAKEIREACEDIVLAKGFMI